MQFFEIVEIRSTCRQSELRGLNGYVISLADESGAFGILVYEKGEVFSLQPADLITTGKLDEEEIAFRQGGDSKIRVRIDPLSQEGSLAEDDET